MSEKGLIRSLSRHGTKSGKGTAGGHKVEPASEVTACKRCGAVYSRRVWRPAQKVSQGRLEQATWRICPACKQVSEGEYFGRVLIRGSFAAANQEAIQRRIANVDERARFSQPERRVIASERLRGGRDVLEVRTTSQKLAHRIVRELKKAFRGRATYHWSDADSSLFAVWEREDLS